jgi:hypothetical protein
MELKDFVITENRSKLEIKYIGEEKGIDRCISELSPKFPTYHLIKLLLKL